MTGVLTIVCVFMGSPSRRRRCRERPRVQSGPGRRLHDDGHPAGVREVGTVAERGGVDRHDDRRAQDRVRVDGLSFATSTVSTAASGPERARASFGGWPSPQALVASEVEDTYW